LKKRLLEFVSIIKLVKHTPAATVIQKAKKMNLRQKQTMPIQIFQKHAKQLTPKRHLLASDADNCKARFI